MHTYQQNPQERALTWWTHCYLQGPWTAYACLVLYYNGSSLLHNKDTITNDVAVLTAAT